MSEKIISERVISSKVVQKTNPIVSKFQNISSSFAAACMAPIIFVIGLGILYYSETFTKHSELIANLELKPAIEVTSAKGMHKITGIVNTNKPLLAPKVGEVIYYDSKTEVYQEVEETERETVTVIEQGQEIEKVIERVKLVEKWVTVETEKPQWAEINLDGIQINPISAKLYMNFGTKQYQYMEDFFNPEFGDYIELDSNTMKTPKLGDKKLTVNYLPLQESLIVIGDISQSKISSGETFIISNKTDAELLDQIVSDENTTFWIGKFLAWLFITIAISSILAPILAFTDFIPVAGKIARTIAGILGAILSLIIVIVFSLLIKYWFIVLILFAVIIGTTIFAFIKLKK
jgi:hypothetical protein